MSKVELYCGREQRKKLEKIYSSNDTVRCRISDMSCDISDQVADETRVNKARVSLHLNKLTDVSNCKYLLVYCWYAYAGELKEELLLCKSLETTRKAIDVFQKWIISFNKIISHGITLVSFAQVAPLSCSVLSQVYNSGEKITGNANNFYALCPSSTCTGTFNKTLAEYLK